MTTKISIHDLLDIVKETHKGILSLDVLKHYGESRPTSGYYPGKVRFSVADTDSEGNALTDGQKEFFKDSKAVSQDGGELLRLYHGTAKAGFTQFRTERMSEYHRGGIWMTTSRDDADAYGGNWEKKLFDPEEREQRIPVTVTGNYDLSDVNPRLTEIHHYRNNDYLPMAFRFDTEEDKQT